MNAILFEKYIMEMDSSKQVMSKIVKGQKSINALEIKKISEALKVALERLLEEKVEAEEEPVFNVYGKCKRRE